MVLIDMALALLVGFAVGWLASFWQHKRQDDELVRLMTQWGRAPGGWVHPVHADRTEAATTQRSALLYPGTVAGELSGSDRDAALKEMLDRLLSGLARESEAADRLGYRKRAG